MPIKPIIFILANKCVNTSIDEAKNHHNVIKTIIITQAYSRDIDVGVGVFQPL